MKESSSSSYLVRLFEKTKPIINKEGQSGKGTEAHRDFLKLCAFGALCLSAYGYIWKNKPNRLWSFKFIRVHPWFETKQIAPKNVHNFT